MKPHLLIQLHSNRSNPRLRFWEDIIDNKQIATTSFIPQIDSILKKKYNLDFLATQNYRSEKADWNPEEIQTGLNRIYRLILLTKNPNIPQDLVDEISLLPQVSYINKGEIISSSIPDQKLVSSQSLSMKYPDNSIYLEEAHRITKGTPEIKIAVLDTGIETSHPEFVYKGTSKRENDSRKFKGDKDFVNIINGVDQFVGDFLEMDNIPDDSVGHGTHVAGIIGSTGKKMALGVAPKCTIIPVKVLGALKAGNKVVGAGLVDNIDAGIHYAVNAGADVINMSLGIKHSGGGLPHDSVIRYALKKNVSVVAASGNDGKRDKYYPGALEGVIAVGASDNIGNVAPFSTFGGHVSVTAPGVNIYSTSLSNGYAMASGTSQAAPYVAGAIALLKSRAAEKGKKIENALVSKIIHNTTDKFTNQFKDQKSGFGRINIFDALKMLDYNL